MPINQGLYRKLPGTRTTGQNLTTKQIAVCRYGIRSIFFALSTEEFSPNIEDQKKANNLETHFSKVFHRFVFSMQDLSRLMHELADSHTNNPFPSFMVDNRMIHCQADCLADHVLSYLNTIVEDIALMIVQAAGYVGGSPIDSMGKLRSVRDNQRIAPVKELLDELDDSGSWWELGFKPKQGGRQLLIHNQHLINFQVSAPPSLVYESKAFLMAPHWGHSGPAIDFFKLLQDILLSFFNWLDRLEIALSTHLNIKPLPGPFKVDCPLILLPVAYPAGVTQYDKDYFPIPLYAGADDLPWTVTVGPGPDGLIIKSG